MKKYVEVAFDFASTTYTFKCPFEDVQVGDVVVCEVRNDLKVGRVKCIKEHSSIATKYVVQVVDYASHVKRKQRDEQLEMVERDIKTRVQELTDEYVLSIMASKDYDLQRLLALQSKLIEEEI